uniref:Transmembrane protein n=1 Tax=Siphoviridae sp. ctiOl67 TaxID=2825622 RepID=A0A8S5QIY4_9CAUD|nr:MAG TPA: hypothetical protein [Siphoviridae sp. ctiOl67]
MIYTKLDKHLISQYPLLNQVQVHSLNMKETVHRILLIQFRMFVMIDLILTPLIVLKQGLIIIVGLISFKLKFEVLK